MKTKIAGADCRSCGACCMSVGVSTDILDHGYADVIPGDIERMSPHVRRQLREFFVDGEMQYATRAKQQSSGAYACRYLRGTPGKRCSCTIYVTRPEICRTFRVGGAACLAARLALQLTDQRR